MKTCMNAGTNRIVMVIQTDRRMISTRPHSDARLTPSLSFLNFEFFENFEPWVKFEFFELWVLIYDKNSPYGQDIWTRQSIVQATFLSKPINQITTPGEMTEIFPCPGMKYSMGTSNAAPWCFITTKTTYQYFVQCKLIFEDNLNSYHVKATHKKPTKWTLHPYFIHPQTRTIKTIYGVYLLKTTYSKPERSHKERKGKERQMKKGSSKAHLNVVIQV